MKLTYVVLPVFVSCLWAQSVLRWNKPLKQKLQHQNFDYTRIDAQKLVDTIWVDEWVTQWREIYRGLFSYDASNKLTRVIYQEVQGSTWKDEYRETYTYYTSGVGQGRIASVLGEEMQNGVWEKSDSIAHTYQSSNPVEIVTFYSWDGNQWQARRRHRIFSGRPDSIEYYDTLNTSNTWDQAGYFRYKYNSSNQLDSVIKYYHDGFFYITHYIRDALGRVIKSRDTFPLGGGFFGGSGEKFYYYRSATSRQLARDSARFFLHSSSSPPSDLGGEKNTYTYDSDDSLIVQVVETYDLSNGWQNSERIRLSYRQVAASLESRGHILGIENPCKAGSSLTLHLEKPAQVEIRDVQGRLIKQVTLSAGMQRVTLPAQPGVYLLRVGNYTQKLLLH